MVLIRFLSNILLCTQAVFNPNKMYIKKNSQKGESSRVDLFSGIKNHECNAFIWLSLKGQSINFSNRPHSKKQREIVIIFQI